MVPASQDFWANNGEKIRKDESARPSGADRVLQFVIVKADGVLVFIGEAAGMVLSRVAIRSR